MKRVTFCLLCTTVLVVSSVAASLIYPASWQLASAQGSESAAKERTITMTGLGRASALPTVAEVQLVVGGDSMNYGPSGPQYQPFDEESLDIVKTALVTLGIEEEGIDTNPFGRSNFDPFTNAGVARFTYSEPDKLTEFLNSLIEELDKERGPDLQGATAVFRVEDCMALEAAAMVEAIDNARERAEEMGNVIDAEVGQVLSIHEQNGSVGTVTSTTCTMLESSIQQMGFNPFSTSGTTENSPTKVEVSVAVEVTFEIK